MECRDGNVVAPHFDMLDTDACFKQHLFLRQAPRQTQFPQPVGYVTDKFFVSGNSYHYTKKSKSQIHYVVIEVREYKNRLNNWSSGDKKQRSKKV